MRAVALAALGGLRDLALTTNAFLLPKKAAALKAAGLQRVTVSLHSLDPATFQKLNGVGCDLDAVLLLHVLQREFAAQVFAPVERPAPAFLVDRGPAIG